MTFEVCLAEIYCHAEFGRRKESELSTRPWCHVREIRLCRKYRKIEIEVHAVAETEVVQQTYSYTELIVALRAHISK